jgi:hypothetical protein
MQLNYNEENTKRSNVSVRSMKEECWKALKILAMADGKTVADFIEKLVRQEIENSNRRG